MVKGSVRDALRKINEVLYDYENISVDVAMRGGKITITADLGQRGTRSYSARMPATERAEAPKKRGRNPGRPAKRSRGESGNLPTGDELLAAISSTKNASMTRLSKTMRVKPRQRLAPILLGLVREGKIRKSGTNFVSTVPGEKKRGPGRPPGSVKKAATKKVTKRGRKAAAKTAAGPKPVVKKAGPRKVGRPAKKVLANKKAANKRAVKSNVSQPTVAKPAPANEMSGSKES